jgi:acyl-[acyl-carrier-protein] desaturase
MPGSTIEGFGRRSMAIAMAGIYDLRIHCDEVLRPVLKQCGVFELTGLSAEGEKSRQELADFMADLDRRASSFEDKRAARQARQEERAGR